MPAKIEMELIQATKFQLPKGGYPERQDYLAALAKSTKILSDKQYDKLTDAAAEWITNTIAAVKDGTEIEDFEDANEPTEDPDETPDDEAADDGDVEATDDGEDTDPEDTAQADADAESENEAEEAEQEAEPKGRSKPSKRAAVAPSKVKPAARKDPAPKVAPKKKDKEVSRYDSVTGAKDRYGCIVGTKTADAVALYEEGATSAQIRKALDGRFYNILKALEEKGHRVERLPGGVFKLTHVEDIKPTKGKK